MFYITISLIALFLSLLLGIYVFISGKRKPENRNFSFLILSGALWIFTNFMADISLEEMWNLFWSRASLVGPIMAAYFFYRFSLVFPKIKKTRKIYRWAISIIALSLIFLSPTKLNISYVYLEKEAFQIKPGILYIPFFIYFVSVVILSLFSLFRGYRGFKIVEKIRVRLIGVGIGISALFGLSANLILPLLNNTKFVSFGPHFILFFILLTSYAILKQGLFDIKIIATELFTSAIFLILLVKTITPQSLSDLIINTIIFILITAFGVLLVRSVTKEVKQREQIEKMAEKVQKAYEVEKQAHEKIKLAYEVEKAAKEEAQRLDKAKDQFTMATQHHLRTPLTSMRGYLELILEGAYGKVPVKLKEILIRFKNSTSRLIKIVNEFLDISQFQMGKEVVFLQPNVDITPILNEIIEELKLEAETKRVYLKMEKPGASLPLIKADPEKLKVALFNVFDNGIKYTTQGGLTIKVEPVDGKICIIVKDTGMGMSREESGALFTRLFERGDAAQKAFTTGRGIGLFITAKIIQAHKGRIWAESEGKDKGSAFYIELPVG